MMSTDSGALKSESSVRLGTQRKPSAVQRARTVPEWSGASATRFSTWTPVTNKPSNQQLFQERTTLILHWFDLWTDVQRKHFLQLVLQRCSQSQLRFTSDCFTEAVPAARLDFTRVLPRFLSLYILSFLSPVDLSAAARVSWFWRFLAEQDCLWSPKCVRRGWFLPYTPSDTEYGAWKRHYVSCTASLDILCPREAGDVYGTLSESVMENEEQKERRTEQLIRETIRSKILDHKRAALKSRRAWLTSGSWNGANSGREKSSLIPPSLTTALVQLGDQSRLKSVTSLKDCTAPLNHTINPTLQSTWTTSSMKSLAASLSLKSSVQSIHLSPVHLLLVSSRIPAYELVLGGALARALPLLYDYGGMTLEALLSLVEKAIEGREVQSIGILTEGSTEDFRIIDGLSITERTVVKPGIREFWERLGGVVVPAGSLSIFSPLGASVSGTELMSRLSTLTGLKVRAPSGICTGSYQHILSDWSEDGDFPPLLYLQEEPLLSWCRQAEWAEQTLQALRSRLAVQLQLLGRESRGRCLGLLLWDYMNFPAVSVKSEVTQVLIEGLVTLTEEAPDNPLQFLGTFLLNNCVDGREKPDPVTQTENPSYRLLSSTPKTTEGGRSPADQREAVVMELVRSEENYVRLLQAVNSVYYRPLRAALDSNRAIITSTNLLTLFCPLLDILEANSVFLQDLSEKLEEWSPLQCVGDVCVRFCTKLRTYTNFFNNYPTAIRTIDTCREMLPAFRAFLKRQDRTLPTRMLSLQELFLSPSMRVEEYVTLLQALLLHTPPGHPDHAHLSSAFNTLLNYRSFVHKLKKSSSQDQRMIEAQQTIHSCPNLQEVGRYLITDQDVALLSCVNEDIAPSLRMYECVGELGLVLFNDALVLSERRRTHRPFSSAVHISYSFLTSVALHSLGLADVTDTKYVQNAFLLESPTRKWICSTEREQDKIRWLGALRSAIHSANHN